MPTAKELRKTFSEQLCNGLLSHAVLIEGEKGTGRQELALWLAKAVVCKGKTKPCENCSSCHKANAGSHPDIKIFEDHENKNSFGIKPIRDLREKLFIAPNESAQKVFLIFNIEELTLDAQNALLKSLEEPPAHTRLIFTCDNKYNLLDTILSRVTVYKLSSPTVDECEAMIKEKYPEKEESVARLFAMAYCGNFGAVERSLSKGKEKTVLLAARTPELLRKARAYTLIKELSELCKSKAELDEYLDILKNIIGNCATDKAMGKNVPIRLSLSEGVKTSEIIERGKSSIAQNCNKDLVLSWLAANLSAVFGGNI